jgi:hypothetical protein
MDEEVLDRIDLKIDRIFRLLFWMRVEIATCSVLIWAMVLIVLLRAH